MSLQTQKFDGWLGREQGGGMRWEACTIYICSNYQAVIVPNISH